MSKLPAAPPSGTRDFYGAELRQREAAIATIKSVFERFGFEPLETPAFERVEVLTGKYGEDEKLIFKIAKRGAKAGSGEVDLALRYDLTVPLARHVAGRGMREGDIFKRYQIGPVWRADRPARGRFREFLQCDVDVVGSRSPLADAEVIAAAGECLGALGLGGFAVRLNSRRVLSELMSAYGVPASLHKEAIAALDKLDRIGAEGVAAELGERGVPETAVAAFREDHAGDEPLDAVRRRLEASDSGRAAHSEVREVEELVAAALPAGRVLFDPFVARGLDYYTGPVFETFYEDDPDALSLSLASGGRYDDLLGMFTGRPMPATGASLGFERLLILLAQRYSGDGPGAQALVCVWDESSRRDCLLLATELRRTGTGAEVYLGDAGLGAQLRYASKRGFAVALIYGPDERASGSVAIKELASGEQQNVPRDGFAEHVAGIVARARAG
jgi:histidyl-tRNA synthetase